MPNEFQNDNADGQSFWSHLAELRSVLLRIAIILFAMFILLFIFMPEIFDNVILAPCDASFPTYRLFDFVSGDGIFIPDLSSSANSISLININLGTQLITQISASFWISVIIGFPVVIYQLWLFIKPGLYEKERSGATKAFIFGNLMFYFGVATAYFMVFPLTLRFLADYQLSDRIENTITLDSYMDTFYIINLAFGIIFELPLLAWMLGRLGILTRKFFSRYRRHAILALTILAAIITPTGDPFTLFIVFVPLYGLWEFSAWLVPACTSNNNDNTLESTNEN